MTAYGCPASANVNWLPGKAIFMLNTSYAVSWSPDYDLVGPYTEHSFTFGFCTKVEELLAEEDFKRQIEWPQGSYCVYRASATCPIGKV